VRSQLESKHELYKLSVEEKRLAESTREDFQGARLTLNFFLEDSEELRENQKVLLENILKQFHDVAVKQAQIKSSSP
jgi:hypothetical protein